MLVKKKLQENKSHMTSVLLKKKKTEFFLCYAFMPLPGVVDFHETTSDYSLQLTIA